MEDELWMRKIKERLEDYSEPLPVSGWERLEKDMPASKPKRRIILSGAGLWQRLRCCLQRCLLSVYGYCKACGRGNAEYGHADAGGCPG